MSESASAGTSLQARIPFTMSPFVLCVALAVTSLLVFLSSLRGVGILGQQNAFITGSSYDFYALGAGIASCVLSVIAAIIFKLVPVVPNPVVLAFALLMAIFWVIGLIVMTFEAPFTDLGNGYISVWASVIVCMLLLSEASAKFQALTEQVEAKFSGQSKNFKFLILNVVFAAVELGAAAILCSNTSCSNEIGYAVAAGVIGIIIPIVLMLPIPMPPKVKAAIAAFNIVWWAIAVLVLTFFEPTFSSTARANGFFGTWGAFLLSILACLPFLSATNIRFINQMNETVYDDPADAVDNGGDAA